MREQTQSEMMVDIEAERTAKRQAEEKRWDRRHQEAEVKKQCLQDGHQWSSWAEKPERLERGWEGRQHYWHSRFCRRCTVREGYSSSQSQEGKRAT